MKQKLPRSLRKYIRQEKTRIHRGTLDIKKQKELIEGLYKKFLKNKIEPEQKNEN